MRHAASNGRGDPDTVDRKHDSNLEGIDSLAQALELLRTAPPDVLMLDKAFGIQAILDWLTAAKVEHSSDDNQPNTAIVVWGVFE